MPKELDTANAVELYLDLLKRCLLNLIYQDPAIRRPWDDAADGEYVPFNRDERLAGRDVPSQAHTQIGMRRLDNIQELVTDVLATGTPGDLIETGVWRGGSTIFMRGILKARGVTDRSVWVADAASSTRSRSARRRGSRTSSPPNPTATGPARPTPRVGTRRTIAQSPRIPLYERDPAMSACPPTAEAGSLIDVIVASRFDFSAVSHDVGTLAWPYGDATVWDGAVGAQA